MCVDSPEVAQPMNSLYVDAELRCEFPHCTEKWGQIACFGGQSEPAMVDDYPVRRRRRNFATIERRVGLGDDRPRLRVSRRLADKVSGLELFVRGVDVIDIEH